jgi:uroporphyrinogen-III synthase
MATAILSAGELPVNLTQTPAANRALASLLELALTETRAQGAYVYRLENAQREARLIGRAGLECATAARPLALAARGSYEAPVILQDQAWRDSRFAGLAEFREHRFEGVASLPVIAGGRTRAVFNVCRLRPSPWKAAEFALLQSLGPAIAAVLDAEAETGALRREVETLGERLETRKMLDRAKGILQEQFQFTEEQAYFSIRRLSRRRRMPMREVAAALIADARTGDLQ